MKLAIIADTIQKTELLDCLNEEKASIEWLENWSENEDRSQIHAFLDLRSSIPVTELEMLKSFLPKPVIINSVEKTLNEYGLPFIRINAWPGFLKRELWEAAAENGELQDKGTEVFAELNRKAEWVKDTPGLISARVIAMIINEAYLALEDNISTRDEIDIAMKTGTNYPFGPFEWASLIGFKNIVSLLNRLSESDKKYLPARSLVMEANR